MAEGSQPRRGLECPKCGCRDFRVTNTERTVRNRVLRRRVCRHCGRRIVTVEMLLPEAVRRDKPAA